MTGTRKHGSSGPALFRLTGAARRDPAIDAWFAERSGELSDIARNWFDQMRRCGPDVRERIHDDCPVACVEDVAFAYVNVFASHVNVGFFMGAYLDDPADLLQGEGKRMRHLKIRPDSGQNVSAIAMLIEDAYLDVRRRMRDVADGS